VTAWAELRRWLDRARDLVPEAHRRELRSPHRLVARFVRFALRKGSHRPVDEPPASRDPELVSLLAEVFRLAARHDFRLRVEGLEHVPAEGPVLLVGNHNGGLLPLDAFFTVLAVHDHHGPERAVNVLVHDFLVEDPLFGHYARRLGLVRAGHAGAQAALAAGGCVLVYPGSDQDTYRPFWQRDRVCLAGRKGFVGRPDRPRRLRRHPRAAPRAQPR
jgi:1-acyl-sn-glycerol-3-phosphate acyltransferase